MEPRNLQQLSHRKKRPQQRLGRNFIPQLRDGKPPHPYTRKSHNANEMTASSVAGSRQSEPPKEALMIAKISIKPKNGNVGPAANRTKPSGNAEQRRACVSLDDSANNDGDQLVSEHDRQQADAPSTAESGDSGNVVTNNESSRREEAVSDATDRSKDSSKGSVDEAPNSRVKRSPMLKDSSDNGDDKNACEEQFEQMTADGDEESKDSLSEENIEKGKGEGNFLSTIQLERNIADMPEESIRQSCDEYLANLKELFKLFITTVERNENKHAVEVLDLAEKINNAYVQFGIYPVKIMQDGRKKAGEFLADIGAISIFCDLLADEFPVELVLLSVSGQILVSATNLLWNYTDHNPKVTFAVRDHPNFLTVLMKKLKEWQKPQQSKELALFQDFFVRGFINILHNLALQDDNIKYLRRLNACDILMPYLESKFIDIKLTATAFLADVCTDKQAKFFSTSPELLRFLLEMLKAAFGNCQHTSGGWRLTEIVRAVRKLARNDTNKQKLVELGVLDLLAKGLHSDLEGEKEVCLEAIWVLSFNNDNVNQLVNNQEMLDLVVSIFQDEKQSKECRRSAEGLLWQLRQQLGKIERYQAVVQQFLDNTVDASKQTQDEKTEGHVMLSYQWADQTTVKKIYNLLKTHGVKVWMDIYSMGQSTRQSMAEAVENASVVLCCMSPLYKESPNCRQELEYATDCRKQIIPLKMASYKPDGWLGLIVSGKIFYDFSGKYDFEAKFSELRKAIQKPTSQQDKDVVDGPPVPSQRVATSERKSVAKGAKSQEGRPFQAERMTPCEVQRVKRWTPNEIQTWLQNFDLQGEKVAKLSGEQIAFLHSLRAEAPEFFYRTLEKKLGVVSLQGLLQFKKALDSLTSTKNTGIDSNGNC